VRYETKAQIDARHAENAARLAAYCAEDHSGERIRVAPLFAEAKPESGWRGVSPRIERCYDIDLATGCWVWKGPFHADGCGDEYPRVAGPHLLCGHEHFSAARGVYEDARKVVLSSFDDVIGTCPTNTGSKRKACVNPAHHEVIAHGQKGRAR
jgi:hypothetical protein